MPWQRMMKFEGPCLFLLCDEQGPHSHPICADCGAVRFGNFSCPACSEERPAWNVAVTHLVPGFEMYQNIYDGPSDGQYVTKIGEGVWRSRRKG